MQFDPKNLENIRQLSKAIGYSWDKLKIFRENKIALLKEYVGSHYSAYGAGDKVPINLLELAFNIYLQRLVAQNPAVSITTDYKKIKEIATRFEMAGNHLIHEIDLGKTLEMAVIGAMFSIGIIKIGLNATKVEYGGVLCDSGQAFASYVSLDDWVQDMTVNLASNGQFEGNFYNVTIDEFEVMFPGKKYVTRDEQQANRENEHGITEGSGEQREEFRKTVRLLDIWLPKFNLILICHTSDDELDPIGEVLKIVNWTGPERGPYRKLGYGFIENNTMPLAPAMYWRDMHELANKLFSKLGKQADRQKTITGVQRGAEDDGNRVIDAEDGQTIALDNPAATKEYSYGGISQETLGFLVFLKDTFSYLAGNLDMLGGLGPQSETLGQDQLLSVSASMRIQKMQKATVDFTQGIVEDLLYYLWNDPNTTIPLVKRVKGFEDVTVSTPLRPEDRENDFVEYNIKIEPYSMQHQTPEAKLQGIRTVFAEFVAPLLPIMQAQGVSLDFEALFKKISKLGNIPELSDIIVFSNPTQESEPVGELPAKFQTAKPPVTTRRYERINRPGATNQGKNQIMMQAMFGGKPQNSEAGSLMRATG